MARRIKFYRDSYYHIYNRGVRKQRLFHDFNDYKKFSEGVKTYAKPYNIAVLQYCFMPNHYHFLIRTNKSSNISAFIQRLCLSYACHYNRKYFTSGHVFQGRFNAKRVEELRYLLFLSRYIHLNPSEIISDFRNYVWSSYRQFTQKRLFPLFKIDSYSILKYFPDVREYQRFCALPQEDAQLWISKLILTPGPI